MYPLFCHAVVVALIIVTHSYASVLFCGPDAQETSFFPTATAVLERGCVVCKGGSRGLSPFLPEGLYTVPSL